MKIRLPDSHRPERVASATHRARLARHAGSHRSGTRGALWLLPRALWYWLPPLAHMGAIIYLAGRPFPPAMQIRHHDELRHAVASGVLALLLYRALRGGHAVDLWSALVAGCLGSGMFGWFIEARQVDIPTRGIEREDLIANAAGIVIAAILVVAYDWIAELRRRSSGRRELIGCARAVAREHAIRRATARKSEDSPEDDA